jgi:hypothetical protein
MLPPVACGLSRCDSGMRQLSGVEDWAWRGTRRISHRWDTGTLQSRTPAMGRKSMKKQQVTSIAAGGQQHSTDVAANIYFSASLRLGVEKSWECV